MGSNPRESAIAGLQIQALNHPNLRLGQLIDNITHEIEQSGKDLFYVSDDELVNHIWNYPVTD